jgi:hypothetical protein
MDKLEQMALQTTKEIVVKFVETGRISPSNFTEHFAPIYREVLRTIREGEPGAPRPAAPPAPAPGPDPSPAKNGKDKGDKGKADKDGTGKNQ